LPDRDPFKARMHVDLRVYGDVVRELQSSLGQDFETAIKELSTPD